MVMGHRKYSLQVPHPTILFLVMEESSNIWIALSGVGPPQCAMAGSKYPLTDQTMVYRIRISESFWFYNGFPFAVLKPAASATSDAYLSSS
jgi:hypothetical protein